MHTQIGEGGGVRSKGGKSKIKSQKGLARKWFDRLTIRSKVEGRRKRDEKIGQKKCDWGDFAGGRIGRSQDGAGGGMLASLQKWSKLRYT
ncbi:MAG: hypothetical protein ACYSR9_08940 [Planctomycetota bacterium]|jgi:hypothetical protein